MNILPLIQLDTPSAPFSPIQVNSPTSSSAPQTSPPPTASPRVNYRQPKSNRLELKNIAALNSVAFDRDDTFVASKKLSESAPPPTPATLFTLFGDAIQCCHEFHVFDARFPLVFGVLVSIKIG